MNNELIFNSVERYIKNSLGLEKKLIFIKKIELIDVIKKYEEEGKITAFYLILSLFKNDVEEQVYDAKDHRLMSVKYITSRKSGNKVRIDWKSENPINEFLDSIKDSIDKIYDKEKPIKFMVLG